MTAIPNAIGIPPARKIDLLAAHMPANSGLASGLPRVMQRLCPLSPFSGTISWRAAPSVLEGVRQRTAPGYWQPTAGGRPASQ